MDKKFIYTIVAAFIVLAAVCVCGCINSGDNTDNATNNTTADPTADATNTTAVANATPYDKTEIVLGANLPTIKLPDATYYSYEIPDDGDEDGLILSIYTESDAADYDVYRFANEDGMTLEEYTEFESEVYDVSGNVLNDGQTKYGYYVAYEKYDGVDYLTQNCIYEDGKDFVEVVKWLKCDEIKIADTGIYLWIPKGYEEVGPTEKQAVWGEVTEYHYPAETGVANFAVRQWKKNFWNYDNYKNFSEKYQTSGVQFLADPANVALYKKWAENGWTLEETLELYTKISDVKFQQVDKNTITVPMEGDIDLYTTQLAHKTDAYGITVKEEKKEDGSVVLRIQYTIDNGDEFIEFEFIDNLANPTGSVEALVNSLHTK